jgi:hypothetical protein
MNMFKHENRSKLAASCQLNVSSPTGAISRIVSFIAAAIFVGSVHSATIADFGTTVPTPGPNDISQLTGGNNEDGLNYFSDNATPPGQTFTTGSNPSGYAMPTLYVQTGGYNANNTASAQTYTLRIYSVSGSTATLISTYVTANVLAFNDGAWLQYSGLTNILQPNTVYAYTHARNTFGWDGMACATGNPYAGGQICLIPAAGGAISFGTAGTSDAAFDVSLVPVTDPYVFPTTVTPASVVAGNSVFISAGVGSGTQPIYYQWLFTGASGIPTKIAGATSINYTIAAAQTTNQGSYSLMVSNNPGGIPTVITNAPAPLMVRAAYNISDFGAAAPTPGPYDIAQLTAGTDLDGLNYFSDNNPPPGQTFTTGSNPSGYTLTGIYLQTGGVNSSQTGTAQTYTLRLFSISGSTATLVSTYLTDNTLGFPDGDWLMYSGMTNILQPNTVYAYTHSRNSYGWDQMSGVLGNTYAGGQACMIPISGGTITTGGSDNLDGTFDVAMVPNGFPAIQNISIAPANSTLNPVYVASPVTLSVLATGASPLHFDWQTDNVTAGATWTDLANSNTNSYALNTTGMAAGVYQFQVIVTNVNNMATSSVLTLNLAAPSSPVLTNDTSITPTAAFVGGSVTLSAAFQGSSTISYQWMFNNGSGAAAILGATNTTYYIASAQLTNNGSYYVIASNGVSPFTASSTPAQLLVAAAAQANTGLAGMFDAGNSAPIPGTYDISQLVTAPPTSVPGINYYVNNDNPPGQTFTTLGAVPNGYQLSSLYIQEELSSDGGGGTNAATYTLGIYSVSGNSAALITSYSSTNQPTIVDGDWIQWTGLTNILNNNSTYAFSIHKDTGGGWWKLANNSTATDLYPGGQVALLPGGGIGAMTFSTDSTIDAGFDLVLSPASASTVNTNPTNILVSVSGNVLHLSWPADHTGWRLLVQTNHLTGLSLNPTDWTTVPGSAGINQTNITINPANKTEFYRMVYP